MQRAASMGAVARRRTAPTPPTGPRLGVDCPSARRTGRLSDRDRTPRMLGERASCGSRVRGESRTRRTLKARTGAHCWLSPPPPSRSSRGLGYRRLVHRLEIRAFADEHLDAAGSLLAARHREHRAAEPLLSERFEQPDATREEVASLWAEKHASGAVALREGQVVGFLARNAEGRSDAGSERLGRSRRLRGGRARACPRPLRLLVPAVGRRGPHAPLRTGTAT